MIELKTAGGLPAFQSFMRLEFSVSAREMVISLFKTIFFSYILRFRNGSYQIFLFFL